MLIVRFPAAADASYSCDVSSSREDKRPLTWLRGPEDSHHSGPPCGANWKGTTEHYLQKPELLPTSLFKSNSQLLLTDPL